MKGSDTGDIIDDQIKLTPRDLRLTRHVIADGVVWFYRGDSEHPFMLMPESAFRLIRGKAGI